jgi:hypothetical protein
MAAIVVDTHAAGIYSNARLVVQGRVILEVNP